jgi:mono/diheme cytochrome c family protein
MMAAVLVLGAAHAGAAETVELQGKKVFDRWCAACHAVGDAYPGTLALQAKYKGEKPSPLEQRTDLNPDFVKFFVRNGVSIMPFFRKTEISDAELTALATYLSRSPR